MPAVEMAAIRTRALSPVEVVDALLARLERVNPALNAFTVVLGDEARAAARQGEDAMLRGDQQRATTASSHQPPSSRRHVAKAVTTRASVNNAGEAAPFDCVGGVRSFGRTCR